MPLFRPYLMTYASAPERISQKCYPVVCGNKLGLFQCLGCWFIGWLVDDDDDGIVRCWLVVKMMRRAARKKNQANFDNYQFCSRFLLQKNSCCQLTANCTVDRWASIKLCS